jgi:hypothetical protein
MKNYLTITALVFVISISFYACSGDTSKKTNDTVLNSTQVGTAVKGDTIMKGETSITNTKSTTSITVDPDTNDSTIVTTTVIKHSKK